MYAILYFSLIWGSTYPSNLNRIVLPQKKAVRIIGKEAYDAYTEPIFQRLKILTFQTYYVNLCIRIYIIGKCCH